MALYLALLLLLLLLGLLGFRRPKAKLASVIGCEEIIFRLALNAKAAMPNTTEAFLLKKSDNGKLSVYRLKKADIASCLSRYNRPKGAFTLHTGRIRTVLAAGVALDVVEDELPTDKCPGHASIIHLPDPQKESEAEEAERIATLLRRQSRQIAPPKISVKR
jgi:hypothetical protein